MSRFQATREQTRPPQKRNLPASVRHPVHVRGSRIPQEETHRTKCARHRRLHPGRLASFDEENKLSTFGLNRRCLFKTYHNSSKVTRNSQETD
jgi:hypothetical protein